MRNKAMFTTGRFRSTRYKLVISIIATLDAVGLHCACGTDVLRIFITPHYQRLL
jgi:hypothetical protein